MYLITNFVNNIMVKFSSIGLTEAEIKEKYKWVFDMFDNIQSFLYPVLYAVMAAGAIYAVILGVNLARAEDASKREEAKKKMIWSIIGIVSIFVLIGILSIIKNNLSSLLG